MSCNNYLKKAILFVCASLFVLAGKSQEEAAIDFNTSATGLVTFSLKCLNPADTVYVSWGDTEKKRYIISKSNEITGQPIGTKNIKIYAKDIGYFNCGSSQVTSLDVSKCGELTYLDCEYNLIETLDVSGNSKLTYLSCYANKLETLDLSKNVGLNTLWCAGNLLKTLDVSSNVALANLYCFSNEITSIDVSKNAALLNLDCGNNKLTTLDVSSNKELQTLFCYLNMLTELDVTKNTSLLSLWCYNNQLSSIDVSKNLELVDLYCDNNKISSIDLSNNVFLKNLNISSNLFDFFSFPRNISTFNSFFYGNQSRINIPGTLNGLYNPANIVDLSAQAFVKDESGNTVYTTFVWRTIKDNKDAIMDKDTDYVVEAVGKFRFSGEFVDSVYCVLTNAAYPDITIQTKKMKLDKTATVSNNLFVNSLSVYPVPSRYSISISGVRGVRLNIFDMQGGLIKTIEKYNGEQIDISNLKNGAYVLESNYKFGKFVKQ